MCDGKDVFTWSYCNHHYCKPCANTISHRSLIKRNTVPQCLLKNCQCPLTNQQAKQLYPISGAIFRDQQQSTPSASQIVSVNISPQHYINTHNLVSGFIHRNYKHYIPNGIISIMIDYYQLMSIYQLVTIHCNQCKSVGNTKVKCKDCKGKKKHIYDCTACNKKGVIHYTDPCIDCNSKGYKWVKNYCNKCNHTGIYKQFQCNRCDGSGRYRRSYPCRKCGGDGKYPDFTSTCWKCNGSGLFKIDKECFGCNGTGGKTLDCNNCNGCGYTESRQTCRHCKGRKEINKSKQCGKCMGNACIIVKCNTCCQRGFIRKECTHCNGIRNYLLLDLKRLIQKQILCVYCNQYYTCDKIVYWNDCEHCYCIKCFVKRCTDKLTSSNRIGLRFGNKEQRQIPRCKIGKCQIQLNLKKIESIKHIFRNWKVDGKDYTTALEGLSHELEIQIRDRDKFECSFCQEWVKKEQLFSWTNCNHQYCLTCAIACVTHYLSKQPHFGSIESIKSSRWSSWYSNRNVYYDTPVIGSNKLTLPRCVTNRCNQPLVIQDSYKSIQFALTNHQLIEWQKLQAKEQESEKVCVGCRVTEFVSCVQMSE